MKIIEVESNQVLPIRHQVLWPDKPLEFCKVEGDVDARHFAIELEQKLISVASIYFSQYMNENIKKARLRKFATLPDYQNKGFGSQLIKHILNVLERENVSTLWLDARQSAISFYKQFGFSNEDNREVFFKSNIPYVKMEKKIL